MNNISFPFPEPANEAERAEFTALLAKFCDGVNRVLRESPDTMSQEDFAPVAAELERFFAAHTPPPEVATLLSWYYRRN
jgi:predicted membrane chloride channel (bestrophin family)